MNKNLDIQIIKKCDMNTIKEELKVPQSTLDYFNDFGIEFFFEINCTEENCLMF